MTLRRTGDGPAELPTLPPGTKPGKRPGHAYAVQFTARRRGHKVLTVAPNLRVREHAAVPVGHQRIPYAHGLGNGQIRAVCRIEPAALGNHAEQPFHGVMRGERLAVAGRNRDRQIPSAAGQRSGSP